MLRVGLTGGMACGKSVVGEMFAARGVYLIQADHIAHQLMQPGELVYQEVVRRFGRDILNPDGSINRARLAQAAFGSAGGTSQSGPARVEELNRIVHPAVIARQEACMDELAGRDPAGIAMVEAALILEAGVGKRFDKLVVVTCRQEQRAERLAARLGISLQAAGDELERRMAAQLPDSQKVKAADYVIDNSGSLAETERQVDRVLAELKRLAQYSVSPPRHRDREK